MTIEADIEREGIEYGPAMRALKNDRQRAFVCALFDAPRKEGRVLWAARVAGYGSPKSTNKSLSVIGSRLNVSDSIQAAISEESQRRLRSLSPTAITALENLLADPTHRDHARGIDMVLDRADRCRRPTMSWWSIRNHTKLSPPRRPCLRELTNSRGGPVSVTCRRWSTLNSPSFPRGQISERRPCRHDRRSAQRLACLAYHG